jgi:K+-transporting ATPase ATPase C chain
MMKALYQSIVATVIFVVLLCVAYPLAVYAVGQVLFHDKANGGLITRDGKIVGARLIAQGFAKPEYFHPRPSAAGDKGYDAANSSGSNLGPTNQKFADGLKSNVEQVLKDNPNLKAGEVPTQLVTASGSGLDPHVSPEAALVQVPRVAGARHASAEAVRALVEEHTEGPQWGIFGDAVVNVLELNLALDEKFPPGK